MNIDVWDLVETIRSLSPKFKSFHLSPCICGAPMWVQPCTLCGYYPMMWDDIQYRAATGKDPHEHLRGSVDKERFCKCVENAGGILEFYLRGFYMCVDPQHDKLDAARKKARNMVWPSAERIWDHFTRDDIDSRGHKKKACGNRRCGVSTGIHDGLTFGRGKLDDYGYWSKPCGPCARAWEKEHPEDGPCWPFSPDEDKK